MNFFATNVSENNLHNFIYILFDFIHNCTTQYHIALSKLTSIVKMQFTVFYLLKTMNVCRIRVYIAGLITYALYTFCGAAGGAVDMRAYDDQYHI